MKFLIVLVAAMWITGIASAQHGNSPAGNVNIGIKGGLNLYDVHHDVKTENDLKVGFHFGMLGHIHINEFWAIQPEIVFSTQGSKYKIDDKVTKYNLSYINVPVLLQYMFDNGFRLEAGPQVGFLIIAKAKNDQNTIDFKDDLKLIDFALSLGASYIFPPTGFGVDARYNFGLSNINKTGTVHSTNRGVQLGVFYIFGHNN